MKGKNKSHGKMVELFSWKTTYNKDHLEVCLPIRRLSSDLYGMWSSMKITLNVGGILSILINSVSRNKKLILTGQHTDW